MSERVTRINDCKVELGRINDVEELNRMAESIAERLLRHQYELDRVLERRQELMSAAMVMGESQYLNQ